MEKILKLEERVYTNMDLLEIAKTYCEFNYDKSKEISVLNSIIDIIIENQKLITRELCEIQTY